MSHLKYIVEGGKEAIQRFIMTPFEKDDELTKEMVNCWDSKLVARKPGSEAGYDPNLRIRAVSQAALSKKITVPEKSVLYVLAHSGVDVSKIGDNAGNLMTAKDLVDLLIGIGLPEKILAIKIWACFTGINGFAQEVRAKFLEAEKGYNPIVVGYKEATGGVGDVVGDSHKHTWIVDEKGKRVKLIGRASAAQVIFAGAREPVPVPKKPIDDYDDFSEADLLEALTPPSPLVARKYTRPLHVRPDGRKY